MNNEKSKQIKKIGDFVIWHSKGDYLPFWVSDLEGYELCSCSTLKEAVEWANNSLRFSKG